MTAAQEYDSIRSTADTESVWLARFLQTALRDALFECLDGFLRTVADGEARVRKLILRERKQEVRLILVGIAPAQQ